MLSSRSDVVTEFVRSSVCLFFCPFFSCDEQLAQEVMMSLSSFVCPSVVILFSLEHSKHLKQDVLRELQRCLFEVSRMFKEVLSVFTENLKGILRKFQECLKDV